MSLSDARRVARERIAELTLGMERPAPLSFGDAVEKFLRSHSSQHHSPRMAHECRRILERHFSPRLQRRELSSIRPVEIASIVDSLQATPSEAEHAYRHVRTMFNYLTRLGLVETSPVDRLSPPPTRPSRERVLSPQELVTVWQQAERLGYPYGTIVRLLILCGQRTAETAALRWSWIDEHSFSIPSSVTKNRRASQIPYGELTKKVLATIPQTGDLLFPARGKIDKPFVGFGVSKISLDKCGVSNFTHHDLRRTYTTVMASPAVGAPIHVIAKLLNHSSGALRGVASIYNRYSYWEEMKDVVQRYETWLSQLLRGHSDSASNDPGNIAG